jgi:hypothetical protein
VKPHQQGCRDVPWWGDRYSSAANVRVLGVEGEEIGVVRRLETTSLGEVVEPGVVFIPEALGVAVGVNATLWLWCA